MVVIFSLYLFFFFFWGEAKVRNEKGLSILSILLLPKLLKKKSSKWNTSYDVINGIPSHLSNLVCV